MSEVHKHTSQFVYLDVYGGSADALPVAVLAGSATPRTLTVIQDSAPEGIDARYHVILTMADTQNEGELTVTWDFEINSVPVTKVDDFEIVTPYLSIAEVKKIWPEASTEEAQDVEAAVRHVINAHCGQSFGYATDKTITVEGHGERALRLPERLLEITGLSTLTAVLNPHSTIIVSDGWYLKKGWSEEVSAIDTDSTYWGGWEPSQDSAPGEPGYEKSGHGPIISAPGVHASPTPWRDDYPFKVTGTWGYKSVPVNVIEAAKLLVNDYACSEALYRDRYLKTIQAADWRLDFSSRAWDDTGNVRADQLLSEYVLLDWAVV